MKGNKNAEGAHDYPISPDAHNMTVEEFNTKYGKSFDPKDLPIWKVTDKYGNIDTTKLTEEQKEYIRTSDHFVKDGDVYVNAVNYAAAISVRNCVNLTLKTRSMTTKKRCLKMFYP